MPRETRNLLGQRFGKLEVIEFDGYKKDKYNRKAYWKCKCDCGQIKSIVAHSLISGNTQSCGCSQFLNKEVREIVGEKFGRLTAIKRIYDGKRHINYLFKCDCGNEKIISKEAVVLGLTKSCGCITKENNFNRCMIDLTGRTFGRLTVIQYDHSKNGAYWLCRCECGKTKVIKGTSLTKGLTTSCGCKSREMSINRSTTHGMTGTRLYRIRSGMIARCYKENASSYPKYGAKGITVCDEWLGENGFVNFYNWAMENGYKDNLTLDRINPKGNYEPSNCRWATYKEQANNTKATVFLTYNGETKPASEWAEIVGISQSAITQRKNKGWTDEECLTVKNHGRRKKG